VSRARHKNKTAANISAVAQNPNKVTSSRAMI